MGNELERLNYAKNGLQRVPRQLAALGVAVAGILALTAIHHPGGMDYIEYWSSARLLLHHTDPYSPARVLALERARGFSGLTPLIMLNPPWTMFLIAPLGTLSVRAGLFLWMAAAVACVIASMRLLDDRSKNGTLALIFAPVLICLFSGQSSPFLLLGFALFLRFHRSRPYLAGASLLLMAIKPHLFLIFWAVLLVDCIFHRRLRILAGGAIALVAATAFSMFFDIHIWQHYFDTLHGYKIQQDFLPTASMLFRALIDVRAFWLLFVPSALAIAWGFWYYSRWKQRWDWQTHGMLLMLVTILVSPYGFFSDEVVLLPSLAFAMAFAGRQKYSGWILLAINTVALAIVATGPQLSSRAYLWVPFAWLAWFLYATNGFWHQTRPQPSSQESNLDAEQSAAAELATP